MARARVRKPSLDDPFAMHMAPPEGETPEDRIQRLAAMKASEETSRQIDEALLQAKRLLDKKKQDVKILLLGTATPSALNIGAGQSESGKVRQ